MSKTFLKRELKKEIKTLNLEIDRRIVRGLSYKYLSLRHKTLTRQLHSLQSSRGLFRFIGRYATAFMF